MLSEEEKKAIEKLNKLTTTKFNNDYSIDSEDKKAIETVLNLITKLQKENEKYKYLYQKALDNTVSSDRENIQLKEQIDLMAEFLGERDLKNY